MVFIFQEVRTEFHAIVHHYQITLAFYS